MPVVLYGAGNFGHRVLTMLRARKIPVVAMIDGKLAEPVMRDGLTIYPLDHPQSTEFARNGCVLVLTVFNHMVDWSETRLEFYDGAVFLDIVTPMEIFDAMPEVEAARYWVAPPQFYLDKWISFLKGVEILG